MNDTNKSVISCAPIVNLTSKEVSLFWSKVAIKDEDECWIWKGGFFAKTRKGCFHINRVPRMSSRVAYFIKHGSIPTDQLVCHTCDVPECVNPKHLFLGTNDDNSKDMVAKDRQSKGLKHSQSKAGPKGSARGEANRGAKLTEEQVKDIRRKYRSEFKSHEELATEYGITAVSSWNIVTHRTWKHI